MGIEHDLEAKLIILGVKAQETYSGTSVAVENIQVKYPDASLNNCIHITYRSRVQSDTAAVDQHYINSILLDEIDLFLESLSLLLARPSQLISSTTWLDGKEAKLDLPAREVPIGLYNFIALWSRRPRDDIRRYTASVHPDGWPLLEHLLSEFRRQPPATKKSLSLPLRWFAKGSDEMSSLDRLVAYWIAFNSLYVDPTMSEQDAIKSYLQRNMDPSIAQRIVEGKERLLNSLSSLPVELGRTARKRVVSQELASLLKAVPRDYVAIVTTLMLTIYGIRNSLFHGAYDPHSDEAQKPISLADYLLAKLLRELIGKAMLGYPLPPTKFVIQERVGL
jgi:hypothetical protein